MKAYGEKIAQLRAGRNMTQAELGAMLNVTSQAVSKWENGLSEPDMDSIRKLCEIFEISFDEFFGVEPKASDKHEATGAVVLAYCDVCDKPLYNPKEYQVSIENGIQHTTCLDCVPKKEEMKRKAEQERIAQANEERKKQLARERKALQDDEKHELKKGLLWGIAGAVGLAAFALFITYFGQYDTTITILSTVFGAFGGYAIVSQCVWGNSVFEVFMFFLRSFKLPGIIFTLDLNGIIFLLVVKILGSIICALLSFFLFIIGLIVTSVYALVLFPFALIKEIRDIKQMY